MGPSAAILPSFFVAKSDLSSKVYMLLFYAMVSCLVSAVLDVMMPSGWLEPEEVSNFVHSRMEREHDTASLAEWMEEDSLGEYPYLRTVSMTCPMFMLATYVVCVYHTVQHLKKLMWWRRGRPDEEHIFETHDRTLRILILPLLGFFSLLSASKALLWRDVLSGRRSNVGRQREQHCRLTSLSDVLAQKAISDR